MRLSVEEAACQILQTVQRHLPQASVDHESLGGTHYFYIDHAGARFSVRFPEGALQTKQKAELQAAIHEVIEQVIGVSRRTPRPRAQLRGVRVGDLSWRDAGRGEGTA